MPSYEIFEKLPDEKREKILRACLEVFSERGYVCASTNDIVKKADISQGILFHYFGNKKNLYLYVINKAIDKALEQFYSTGTEMPADIFDRITASGMIKLKIAIEEPQLYKLIFLAFVNTPASLKEEIQDICRKPIAVPMLTEGLDFSKLRSGIDPQKAVEVVLFFMEGLQARYIEAFKNMQPKQSLKMMDKLAEDSKVYMDILKKGIYNFT